MFESLQGQVDPEIRTLLEACDYTIFQLDANGKIQSDACDAQNLFATPDEFKQSCFQATAPTMNSRVLVVSPYFPPANGADAHRVRTTLPFFHEFGWQADVLAVDPECLAVPHDAWLLAGIPAEVSITRSSALSLKWSKIPGLGTLDFRAYTHVRKTGNRLLAENPYQLIYFSTTVFALTALGPYWKKRFGVPYVVDYQDPWFTDYYRKQRIRPPGGHLKYWVSDRIARWQEPRVIRDCTGLTAVSEEFPNELERALPGGVQTAAFCGSLPRCQSRLPPSEGDATTTGYF